tara:strand:- start:4585 stop:5037 length:453 start_codon:yes stop_codon:yes gene_type:complete
MSNKTLTIMPPCVPSSLINEDMFLVTKIVTDDATHYCNIICEDDPHLITIKDIFTEETFRLGKAFIRQINEDVKLKRYVFDTTSDARSKVFGKFEGTMETTVLYEVPYGTTLKLDMTQSKPNPVSPISQESEHKPGEADKEEVIPLMRMS